MVKLVNKKRNDGKKDGARDEKHPELIPVFLAMASFILKYPNTEKIDTFPVLHILPTE